MADYLPLMINDISSRKTDDGEMRLTAHCQTIQPEKINLNLSRLDAARLSMFHNHKGAILMVPIRRGEMNGRAFTSITDDMIFPASNLEATFDVKITEEKKPVSVASPSPVSAIPQQKAG